MAVCSQCGASTSARRCPRCGGETSPFATPRPESERPAAARPPAATTAHIPLVEARYDLPAGEETIVLPAVRGEGPDEPWGVTPQREVPPAASPPADGAWRAAPLPDLSHPVGGPPRQVVVEPIQPVPPAPVRPARSRGGVLLASAVVALLLLTGVVWVLTHRAPGISEGARRAPDVVQLPQGARPCAASDAPESGLQVYAGNDATTCGLAENLRTALGDRRGSATITAYSPKTGRPYDMTCTGDVAMACTGGNGAVVYLVPRTARVVRASS